MSKQPPKKHGSKRPSKKSSTKKTSSKRPPKKAKKPPPLINTVRGTIRLHPRGFGFVTPENQEKHPADIFIPKHMVDNAVDGDIVEVLINPDSNWDKGPDGKIVSIVQRGRSNLVGIIHSIEGDLLAYVPILGPKKQVVVKPTKKGPLPQMGDRIQLSILDWGDRQKPTICQVEKILGNVSDPQGDLDFALAEHNIPRLFPTEVVEEAKNFGSQVEDKDLVDRTDFTDLACITIDPETAKDFDDALAVTKSEDGHYHLSVHIADVAHYVKGHSNLDREAFKRGNSTYFPGTCIPMLPEELSNNLCSLREGVIRLTASVLMKFSPEGTLINSSIHRAFIKSRKRLTYGEAKQILSGELESSHKESIVMMKELCELLKAKRSQRGSIDFALPELVITVDEKGAPTGVRTEEYDITHQMVEEFMLKANEVVATTLSTREKPQIYRVHEEPATENLEEFYALVRLLGFTLPPDPSPADVQNVFAQAKDTPFTQQLAIAFIRTLKIASYSPRNVGHFGLSLEYYCHFTSPIRRYSDLITQRLLFDEEDPDLDLDRIGIHCSETERTSFRAETSVKLMKKLRLLNMWFEEDPERTYVATISRIKPFGLSFELKELFFEGFLHISELTNDYFVYNPDTSTLHGRSSGKLFKAGGEISVRLVSTDLILLTASWEIEGNTKAKSPRPRRKKRR